MGIAGLALVVTLAGGVTAPPGDGRVVVYSRLGLELQLPELDGMEQELRPAGTDEVIGVWRGRHGASDVTIRFHHLQGAFAEPGDAADRVLADRRRRVSFGPLARSYVDGSVGRLPYGELLKAELRAAPGEPAAGTWYAFGALLEVGAYVVEVDAQPTPAKGFDERLLGTLAGIAYDGPVVAPEWTLADLRDLWRSQAPESCRASVLETLQDERAARKHVLRTEHYVVVSSAAVGRRFGQALENAFHRLDRLVEFEQVRGRRLLPVLLFGTPDEFRAWCASRGASPEACAEAQAWVADGIYGSWYVDADESAHERALFAQLLGRRLKLDRHAPWLSAGLTDYLLLPRASRAATAERLATPAPGLLADLAARDGSAFVPGQDAEAAGAAALFVEFLCEGAVGKRSLPAFLRAAREVPGAAPAALDEVFQAVYGLSTDELEQRFAAYCAAR